MTKAPVDEKKWEWLGTARFWTILIALSAVLGFALIVKRHRLEKWDAVVPVVTLSGPTQATAGSKARYAVLVRDRFGAPIANAPVRIGFVKYDFYELAHGTTSEAGEAALEISLPNDFAEERGLRAECDVGVTKGTAEMLVGPVTQKGGSMFVSTDKPLYQPGQTVHIRALAMASEKPLADKKATIEIRAAGIKVFREEKRTSAFGIVSVDFTLADQVKLGTYDIEVRLDDPSLTAMRSVEVKRYSLPKLEIAFDEVSPFARDRSLVARGSARWIFGEPVTKGRVFVTLSKSGYAKSATVELDKEGHFDIEIPPVNGRWDRGSYTLGARLHVEGAPDVHTRTTITPQGSSITLEALPESGALALGTEQTVFVVAQHPEREGIEIKSVFPDGPVAKTNADGIARVKVHPTIADRAVILEATRPDGSSGRLEITPARDRLVVSPDKESYTAGDTAHVTVLAAEPGERVTFRATKGAEPIAHAACAVAPNGRCEVDLAIPKSLSGLVWIHAMSLPKAQHEVRLGRRLVLVTGGERDLDLKLTPNKAEYTPREVGSIDVAVSAGGKGAKAQLGVGVADEAVFALADVRPDLEKLFFTADRYLDESEGTDPDAKPWQRYKSDEGSMESKKRLPIPAGQEARAIFDPALSSDLRATILAALSSMPEVGGFEQTSRSNIAEAAALAVRDEKRRTAGLAVMLLVGLHLVSFLSFAVYGFVRLRRQSGTLPEDEVPAFEAASRSLLVDWLIGVLAPPLLAIVSLPFGALIAGESAREKPQLFGAWLALAVLGTVLVTRAVVRIRRMTSEETFFRRVVPFLPVGLFFGHAGLLFSIGDDGRYVRELFAISRNALFIPALIVLAVQLTFGLLSVIRNTLVASTTTRRRVWLLLSRASFLGLPLTLVALAGLTIRHVRDVRTSWADFVQEQREPEMASASSDNKEGGTGTRAKGEEGSMGNPNAKATNKRFGVQGQRDDGKALVVRDYFPETLLWAPEIMTDDTGHAKISVPFADSITTWRFGLRAVSQNGGLGSATLPLVVKQDFFVEASLPPTLTQGDELGVPVTVFSYAAAPQDVVVEIEGDGITPIGDARRAFRLSPREARGLELRIRAEKAGERAVRVKATSAARGDALERKITVVPNGMRVVRTTNGHLVGSKTASIDFPKDAIEGGNDLSVKIYGGPLGQIGEGLEGVFQMPYGCFEQTSSTTYPSILALDFLERSKAVSPELEHKAREYISLGYQRLISFEVPTGGFSPFGRFPASPTLSAYGLLELADMAKLKAVTLDESLMSRTRSFIYEKRSTTKGWLRDDAAGGDDPVVTAYIAWALASANAVRPSGTTDDRLPEVLDLVSTTATPAAADPYALALRSLALVTGGRAPEAAPLLEQLASKAVRGDDGVHWTSSARGVLYSYGPSLDIEVTGLASHALALGKVHPGLRAGALDWLVARKGSHGTWSTTQATIAAMRALLDEARPNPKETQEITLLADGNVVETFKLEPAARDVHRLISLRSFAGAGAHAIEIKATGTADIAYQLVGQHYLPWHAPDRAGLSLEVAYGSRSIRAGETTTAKVTLGWKGATPGNMPLVEVAIPPGFTAETDKLDTLAKEHAVQRYAVERGKLVLYLVKLEEGKPLELDIPFRASRSASVTAPASVAYLYYEPEVRTETAPVTLKVL